MIPDRSTWNSLPTTRADAKALHVAHFFTGEPCSRDHIYLRKASSGNCIKCDREEDYARRHGYHLQYRRDVTASGRQAWQLRKLLTPPNRTGEERKAVAAFYDACPEGFVVEHGVPFEHDDELLAGLHVLGNLRYFRHGPNVAKGGELAVTQREAAKLVAAGVAIWRSEVSADFRSVDWRPHLKRAAARAKR